MRTFITLCALIAAAALAWQYSNLSEEKTAADARLGQMMLEKEAAKQESARQISAMATELEAANAQIAQLTAQPKPQPAQPTPKPNWIEERNRNWTSSLNKPATGGQRSVYFRDTTGRYWVDSAGNKIYFP